MYKIQVVAQMGVQFTANLLKDDQYIGGIGNDAKGLFINLREKLTVVEMNSLMAFILTLHADFRDLSVTVRHLTEEQ